MADSEISPRPAIMDAALRLLGRDGLAGLSESALDAAADLPAGTTADTFPHRSQLVLAINDRIVADTTGAWLRRGPLAPQTIDEFAGRFATYAAQQAREDADVVRARIELMFAHPEVLLAGHLALSEMIHVLLDRLGVAEPAGRAQLVVSVVDGTIIRHCSVQRGTPVDEAGLARAIKRIVT